MPRVKEGICHLQLVQLYNTNEYDVHSFPNVIKNVKKSVQITTEFRSAWMQMTNNQYNETLISKIRGLFPLPTPECLARF